MELLLPELIEEIMLNLPHKDLVRSSAVSKSWNSKISDDPLFARKQKNRATLFRRHRLIVYVNDVYDDDKDASFRSLAPMSSDLHIKVVFPDTNIDTRSQDFAGQFEGNKPYLRAYCDELWCVQVKEHLFLWNPSMRNNIQLPRPSSFAEVVKDRYYGFFYGLAYDSVNDDYKILQIGMISPFKTELYSLKNNCWREIEPVSSDFRPSSKQRCEFVEGRFHWIGPKNAGAQIIVFFDLSTDKYGEVTLPQYDKSNYYELEVLTLNGMLCAFINYGSFDNDQGRFVLWVMEEYGVEKSWNKRFDIILPHLMLRNTCIYQEKLTPLYLFDNNDLLVKRYGCCAEDMHILMYRNGEARPMWEIVKGARIEADAFLYVESLITLKNFSKN